MTAEEKINDGYEVDFLPVDSGEKNGDAITARIREDGVDTIYVIDGGTKESGEKIVEHINKYYETNHVDYVINTHPDNDHVSGLSVVLDKMDVGEIWMHQPWNYVDEVIDLCTDRRITENSLEHRLEESLKQATSLRDLAIKKKIPIKEPFQGTMIGHFYVLSPNEAWYIELLKKFKNMPLTESSKVVSFVKKSVESIYKVLETWNIETLANDPETSAQNESSVILYADILNSKFLLTGDAGVQALERAYNYAVSKDINLKQCDFYQVPHHGGRHNVSPDILDKILGQKLPKQPNDFSRKAYACVSKDNTTHPKRSVTNAFMRRGVEVASTSGGIISRINNFPARQGYSPIDYLPFFKDVEK